MWVCAQEGDGCVCHGSGDAAYKRYAILVFVLWCCARFVFCCASTNAQINTIYIYMYKYIYKYIYIYIYIYIYTYIYVEANV